MKKISLSKKLLVVALIALTCMPLIVSGKSSSEIGDEIKKEQDALAQNQKDLEKLQEDIKGFEATAASADGELQKLEAEIRKIDAELQAKKIEVEIAKQNKELKELAKKQRQIDQNINLKYSYMDWRSVNIGMNQMIGSEMDYQKIEQYSATLTGSQQKDIFSIAKDLKKIEEDIDTYSTKIVDLEVISKDLQVKKQELEVKLAYFYGLKQEASNLGASISNAQNKITGLLSEQQQARSRENMILNQPPQNPNPPVDQPPVAGGFRFMSQGRDLYQGHGVGMSQWGAYGMGANGWNYGNILTFYYTGVSLVGGYEGQSVTVEGYGGVNIEDYVAGQGEIPGRACGNSEQAAARPDKYVVDNPNSVWDCWPEETIKAQAIAFRTYGIKNRNFMYNDARSQVYTGSQYSRWVADETRGQIVTYGGAPIDALYSSDNSQGWGTANNDTIFQNIHGDGTPYPYLRAVNDSGAAMPTQWTYWQARTNTYSYESIKDMIIHNINMGYYDAGINGILAGIINDIGGTVTGMNFERDPSNRVKKVWLTGPNGGWRSLGGWWFKNLWINWVYDRGTYDYIYSQTFFLENV